MQFAPTLNVLEAQIFIVLLHAQFVFIAQPIHISCVYDCYTIVVKVGKAILECYSVRLRMTIYVGLRTIIIRIMQLLILLPTFVVLVHKYINSKQLFSSTATTSSSSTTALSSLPCSVRIVSIIVWFFWSSSFNFADSKTVGIPTHAFSAS